MTAEAVSCIINPTITTYRRAFSVKRSLRIFAVVMALVCMMTTFCGMTTALAEGKSMKSVKGITWDLKAKKEFKIPIQFSGVGAIDRRFKITKLSVGKISDTEKTATITFSMNVPKSIPASKVHKIIKSKIYKKTGAISSGWYYAVVDYNTGESLEAENRFGVTVEVLNQKESNKKTYKDKDGCYVWCKKVTYTIKITYPASYKGLCFGVGGFRKDTKSSKVNKFFSGKITFDKAKDMFNPGNPKMAHFMRIK